MKQYCREIEFKFGVPKKQAFDRLVQYLDLSESVLAKGVRQINHFFDSRRQCLHHHQLALRLREENNNHILTVKGERNARQNGNKVLSDRIEEQVTIPQPIAEDLLQGRLSILQVVADHFNHKSASLLKMIETACIGENLVHIGHFSNERIYLPDVMLSAGNANETVTFELDTSTFPDDSIDYEIEIEISEHIDAANTEAALIELFRQAGIEWHTASSKAERFYTTLHEGGGIG